MRRSMLLAIAILLPSIPVYAAQPVRTSGARQTPAPTKKLGTVPVAPCAPTFELPRGAVLVTELNLSQNDLLGMVKQAIPAFTKGLGDASGEIGQVVKMLDLNELANSVQGVTALRMVQFKFDENVDTSEVIRFFESQAPASKGWSRVFYNSTMMSDGMVAVYSQQGKAFLGIAFSPSCKENYIVGTSGFLDIPKLAAWAGNAMKMVSVMENGGVVPSPAPSQPQPQPPSNPPAAK